MNAYRPSTSLDLFSTLHNDHCLAIDLSQQKPIFSLLPPQIPSPPTSNPYHLHSIRGGANPTHRWSARSLELSAPRLPCPRRLLAHSPAPEFLRLPIYRLHREILAQAAAGAAHRLFDFDPRTACVRGLPPGTGAASRLCAAPIAVPVGHRRAAPIAWAPRATFQFQVTYDKQSPLSSSFSGRFRRVRPPTTTTTLSHIFTTPPALKKPAYMLCAQVSGLCAFAASSLSPCARARIAQPRQAASTRATRTVPRPDIPPDTHARAAIHKSTQRGPRRPLQAEPPPSSLSSHKHIKTSSFIPPIL